ncbi:MAG TPA: DMT family transporter [Myxococcaceae bacterium]
MRVLQMALLLLLGLAGGASLVIQAALNAGLLARLDSVSWAGFVSYAGGTLAMVCALVIGRAHVPVARFQEIPPLWFVGGLFGAAYIGVSIVLLPRLGAATVVALVVTGQLISSMVVDQFALLGVPQHPFGPGRALGALLLLAGVVLIRR